MKTNIEDNELRRLLKSVKPESPGFDFSDRVMNRIFEEQNALEQVKMEPLLGKGFWIILALFLVLFAVMAMVSGNSPSAETTPALIPDINTENVLTGYRAFFEKLGNLPASLAGIFLATSLLVVLEKFLGSRKHVLS
jgi:hypothetical protein